MWRRIFQSHHFGKPRTRFQNLDEFYQAIPELSARLRVEGHPEEAQRLDMLMHISWTTGSELLGELVLALSSMRGSYSAQLRKEIRECEEFARHHRRILHLV